MSFLHHHSRVFLCTLVFALAVVAPIRTRAHEGVHSPDLLAEVSRTVVSENTVDVTLTLTGLGGPLVLVGIEAEGAQSPRIDPVYVNFAEDVAVQTAVTFPTAPPPIFTLTLDFGPLGHGAVVVILP